MFLSQRKKVRALPHVSGVHRVSGLFAIRSPGCKRAKILPSAEIGGAVQQHASAFATLPRADTHIPPPTFRPQAGISEAGQFGVAWRREYGGGKFRPRQEKRIIAGRQALRLQVVVGAIAKCGVSRSNRSYAGVQNRGGSVADYGAA